MKTNRRSARALDGVADGRAGVRRGPKGVAVEDGPTARLPREGAGEVGGWRGARASAHAYDIYYDALRNYAVNTRSFGSARKIVR